MNVLSLNRQCEMKYSIFPFGLVIRTSGTGGGILHVFIIVLNSGFDVLLIALLILVLNL